MNSSGKHDQFLHGSSYGPLVATGISGLDDVLLGGFPKENVVLVEGAPGTGKTALAMEFALRGALEHGENAVIMSFECPINRIRDDAGKFGWNLSAAETAGHVRLLKTTPDQIVEDLQNRNGVLSQAIKEIGAKRVVIDGLTPLKIHCERGAYSSYRETIHNLYDFLRSHEVTSLLTTEAQNSQVLGETGSQHEHFVCDSIVTLRKEPRIRTVSRSLEVSKSRGHETITGRNSFEISKDGVKVFVRTSARERLLPPVPASHERVHFGLAGLDELLGGGPYRGSSTLLIGISGTGKTVSAMHFLCESARVGEKALLITLDEQPTAFIRNAEQLGFNMQELVDRGDIIINSDSPLELNLDAHFAMIADSVKENGIKRIVIDSVASYDAIFPQNSRDSIFALTSYLKSQGVTSLFCYECPEMIGVSNLGHEIKASSIADNIVLLNFVEISTRLRRALTVTKTQGPSPDEQTREFVIRRGGINFLDESAVPNAERVPQLPLSSYYGVLARSPTRHSPIIDEHVASGKPMPKSRVPRVSKAAKSTGQTTAQTSTQKEMN